MSPESSTGVRPFVSVLISTKDRRPDLAKALASLEGQDYPRERFEVIVVEETDQPAPPSGARYVAIPKEGRGFGYTRAVALRHARGPLVAFIDDDCEAEPSWLRELVRPLMEDPVVLGVAGCVRVRNANPIGICENILGFPGGGIAYLSRAAGQVVETRHLSTCNCAYRAEVLQKVGGFPEDAPSSGEDYLVGRSVSRLGRCVYTPRAVVFHKPRGTLRAVFRWFIRRGRQEVWLLRHYPGVAEFRTLHLVSTSLALRAAAALAAADLVGIPPAAALALLLVAYGVLQNFRYRFCWRYYRAAWLPLLLPVTKLVMGLGGEAGRWIEAARWARDLGRWRLRSRGTP
jgi:GT2 family glycosyltransferase